MTPSAPAPAIESKPEAVNITLVAPTPPAISAPALEPEPLPPKPVATPQPSLPPKPSSRPAEPTPDLFAAQPAAEPTPATSSDAPPSAATAAAVSEPIFDADYLDNPAPVYPKLSRQRKEHGVVLLRVHVLASGTADQLEVLESSGFDRLDEAALRAVKRWQFVPAKRGDELVSAWVRVPVRFNLNG